MFSIHNQVEPKKNAYSARHWQQWKALLQRKISSCRQPCTWLSGWGFSSTWSIGASGGLCLCLSWDQLSCMNSDIDCSASLKDQVRRLSRWNMILLTWEGWIVASRSSCSHTAGITFSCREVGWPFQWKIQETVIKKKKNNQISNNNKTNIRGLQDGSVSEGDCCTSLVTWVQAPGLQRQMERSNCTKLSSNVYMYAMAHMPVHRHYVCVHT